jgi:propionyl-CoA carboxylase alpha chain
MPGLVLRVLAEPGMAVTAGQPLLVLEAMKMEQTVSAPADGVLAELHAKAGDQVSTGQVLAVLEAPPSADESSPARDGASPAPDGGQ